MAAEPLAAPKRPAVLLQRPTSPDWLPQALAHFDQVLSDHAHCEKKAASNALSLLQAYPQLPGLAAQMARLAHEESGHLARVLAVMASRGIALGRDPGDPYAQGLQALMRPGGPARALDRLLVAAVIEARSCERLALLAGALEEAALRRLYTELARSEAGHQALFFRLAAKLAGEGPARERLEELCAAEAKLLTRLPIRPAIH